MTAAELSSSAQGPKMQPPPPETAAKPRRKTSFSEALNKFTSNAFTRRRTTNNLPNSTSLNTIHTRSRLPTPSGIPRSTSFFSTLNSFASATATSTRNQIRQKDTNVNSGTKVKDLKAGLLKSTSTSTIPVATARIQKSPEKANIAPSRRAHTPYRHSTGPVTPTSTQKLKSNKSRRESSVQITQHKLMQPLPPPLPKSKTMSALLTGSPASASAVSSASASKRGSGRGSGITLSGRASVKTKENEKEAPSPLAGKGKIAQAEALTPIRTPASQINKVASANPIGTDQKQTTKQTPPDTKKPLPELPVVPTNPRQVTEAQPHGYWAGRLSALNDRFRMEDMEKNFAATTITDDTHTEHLSPSHRKLTDEERRLRRVFIHLHSLCLTDEARASLKEFQVAYEAKYMKPVTGAGAVDASLRERTGFFDKLMGKK